MKPCKDKPCDDCPMRRKSLPGWLGADDPDHFIHTVHTNDEMPCHRSVDYERRDWEDQIDPLEGTATACAGVAIYHANVLKSPRSSWVRRLPADKVTVFASPAEFLKHHKSSGLVWNEEKRDYDQDKAVKPSAKQRKARMKAR